MYTDSIFSFGGQAKDDSVAFVKLCIKKNNCAYTHTDLVFIEKQPTW